MSAIRIGELMACSGVGFGTSGARGLAVAMTDEVCCAYVLGFVKYLESLGELVPGRGRVLLAGDLRPSTGRILEAACRAVESAGHTAELQGRIPSPALAAYAFHLSCPSVMVTGSHIPDDRNGIKFNRSGGEFLKADEAVMAAQVVPYPEGAPAPSASAREELGTAREFYVRRYLEAFPGRPLSGLRVGVYQHSAVGRTLMVEILAALGAEVEGLGWSDRFVPVDTEAIRAEDVAWAKAWGATGRFDALVSADGDSDRPLVGDEKGCWLRGDIAALLCARFLGADSVSLPVSCNTAVERTGWFPAVRRTRIGSPHVVASMNEELKRGAKRVVGFEANGGFLLGSNVALERGGVLGALPTRDAMVVIVANMMWMKQRGKALSACVAELPHRFTASDRLQEFPGSRGKAVLEFLKSGAGAGGEWGGVSVLFGSAIGGMSRVDETDGVRIEFSSGDILHFRQSGNAPEFRCYSESSSETRAQELVAGALRAIREWSEDRASGAF